MTFLARLRSPQGWLVRFLSTGLPVSPPVIRFYLHDSVILPQLPLSELVYGTAQSLDSSIALSKDVFNKRFIQAYFEVLTLQQQDNQTKLIGNGHTEGLVKRLEAYADGVYERYTVAQHGSTIFSPRYQRMLVYRAFRGLVSNEQYERLEKTNLFSHIDEFYYSRLKRFYGLSDDGVKGVPSFTGLTPEASAIVAVLKILNHDRTKLQYGLLASSVWKTVGLRLPNLLRTLERCSPDHPLFHEFVVGEKTTRFSRTLLVPLSTPLFDYEVADSVKETLVDEASAFVRLQQRPLDHSVRFQQNLACVEALRSQMLPPSAEEAAKKLDYIVLDNPLSLESFAAIAKRLGIKVIMLTHRLPAAVPSPAQLKLQQMIRQFHDDYLTPFFQVRTRLSKKKPLTQPSTGREVLFYSTSNINSLAVQSRPLNLDHLFRAYEEITAMGNVLYLSNPSDLLAFVKVLQCGSQCQTLARIRTLQQAAPVTTQVPEALDFESQQMHDMLSKAFSSPQKATPAR